MNEAIKILLTGGAGFIGSNMLKALLKRDFSVVVVDNFSTGSLQNIFELQSNNHVKIIHGDITDSVLIEKLSDMSFSYILNFACPASPDYFYAHSLEVLKTNVLGMLNLCSLAVRHDALIFQSSTSEVYGDAQIMPQSEKYWGHVNPNGMRACYDEGKRCAETILYDYHRCYGIDVRVARIFNTYGPRMQLDDGRVIINFLSQAICGNDLTVYGDGTQTRSYCYVDDLVEGILRLIFLPIMPSGPVNLGNPEEYSIDETAQIICKLTGSSSSVVYLPRKPDDPKRRLPDISLAKELLDWKPHTSFQEGLERCVNYYKAQS